MVKVAAEWSGDPSKLLAAYDKLYEADQKHQAQIARTADQKKKHHGDAIGHISAEVTALTGMAVGYASIGKGVEFLGEAYREWHARMKEVAEAQKQINQETLKGIALSG